MNLRDALNQAGPNSIGSSLQQLKFGEAMAICFLDAAADNPTESIAVTANVATLAKTPSCMPFQVNGSAGTHTGIKIVRQGPITGEGALIPQGGEVIWDGGVKLLFSSYDHITHTIVTYATAPTDLPVSLLERSITDPQGVDNMDMRTELNIADQNRLSPALSLEQGGIAFGEAMALLLTNAYTENPTETAVTPSSNVATLAAQPVQMFIIAATAATHTGVKKLLIGPISGDGAITPATGEAVWDGGTKVLFSSVDVVTAAAFLYSTAAGDVVSCLLRDAGVV